MSGTVWYGSAYLEVYGSA